jgi:hypothetical protein
MLTKPLFYENQIKTGNQVFEILSRSGIKTVHIQISAQPQAGKTGMLIYACLQMYHAYQNNRSKKPNFLVIGPSDKVLKEQTFTRFMQCPQVFHCLVGGKVWHAPDAYASRDRELLNTHLRAIVECNEPLYIIWDESHIGNGTTNKKQKLQKLPEFFNTIIRCLPGYSEQSNVKTISVSATPFSVDAYIHDEVSKKNEVAIAEVYLPPGEGYVSLRKMRDDGRLFPHFSRRIPKGIPKTEKDRIKKENALIFKKGLTDLLQSYKGTSGYGIIRATVKADRKEVIDCCAAADVDYQEYNSSAKNIKEFELTLHKKPEGFKVLIIVQSYKQGKTINQQHICFAYENDTRSGRNSADIIQSGGRYCGYSFKEAAYPIFCDLETIDDAIEYYEACAVNDFGKKRALPMDSTHTKRHEKTVPVRKVIKDYFEDGVRARLHKMGIPDSHIYSSKCSTNNSADVAAELLNLSARQSSKNGFRRYNIRHMDKPNRNHRESWTKAFAYHGLYCVVIDTPQTVSEVTTVDKSYFSAEPEALASK